MTQHKSDFIVSFPSDVRPALIIIDVDGTMAREEHYGEIWEATLTAVREKFGAIGPEPKGFGSHDRKPGTSTEEYIAQQVYPDHPEAAALAIETYLSFTRPINSRFMPKKIEGADELIDLMQKHKIPHVYASNGDYGMSDAIMQTLFGDKYPNNDLQVICSASKPQPSSILQVMKALGVSSGEHIWVFGNSMDTDMMAAHNAGAYPILLFEKDAKFQKFQNALSNQQYENIPKVGYVRNINELIKLLEKNIEANKAKLIKESQDGYYKPRIPWNDSIYQNTEIISGIFNITETPDKTDSEIENKRRIAKGTVREENGNPVSLETQVSYAIEYFDKQVGDELISTVYNSVVENLKKHHGGELPKHAIQITVPVQVAHDKLDRQGPYNVARNVLTTVSAMRFAEKLNEEAKNRGDNIEFVNYRKKMKSGPPIRLIKAVQMGEFLESRRGSEDVYGRFIRQPNYDVSDLHDSQYVLIVDDHVQTGATTKAMMDSLERAGIPIVGLAALSCHPETKYLPPSKEILDIVNEAIKINVEIFNPEENNHEKKSGLYLSSMKDLDNALGLIKLSRDTLNAREVLILAALFIDDSRPEYKEFFAKVKKMAGFDDGIKERSGDSVNEEYKKPAVTPKQFYKKISDRITEILNLKQWKGLS